MDDPYEVGVLADVTRLEPGNVFIPFVPPAKMPQLDLNRVPYSLHKFRLSPQKVNIEWRLPAGG
jgi:hypothetical protein